MDQGIIVRNLHVRPEKVIDKSLLVDSKQVEIYFTVSELSLSLNRETQAADKPIVLVRYLQTKY